MEENTQNPGKIKNLPAFYTSCITKGYNTSQEVYKKDYKNKSEDEKDASNEIANAQARVQDIRNKLNSNTVLLALYKKYNESKEIYDISDIIDYESITPDIREIDFVMDDLKLLKEDKMLGMINNLKKIYLTEDIEMIKNSYDKHMSNLSMEIEEIESKIESQTSDLAVKLLKRKIEGKRSLQDKYTRKYKNLEELYNF